LIVIFFSSVLFQEHSSRYFKNKSFLVSNKPKEACLDVLGFEELLVKVLELAQASHGIVQK